MTEREMGDPFPRSELTAVNSTRSPATVVVMCPGCRDYFMWLKRDVRRMPEVCNRCKDAG